jgi:IclR family acetate operon transcriptional repressor
MDSVSRSNPRQAAPRQGGAERVLAILKELARHPGGIGLDELSQRVGAPKSSVHRALAALRRAEFAMQPRPGHYELGSEFVRLAYAHQEARQDARLVTPCLEELSEMFGETTHYAELEGSEVVYRAKVTHRRGGVQMTSIVGGRNPAYCTGVGKAILSSRLAALPDAEALVATYGPLEPRTPSTLSDPAAFVADLRLSHERGYALDNQESELGINCIAFPVFLASPSIASGGISVAALTHRMTLAELQARAESIRETILRHLGSVTR